MDQEFILAHLGHAEFSLPLGGNLESYFGANFGAILDSIATAEPTVGTTLMGMAIAFGFGAVHALAPGHGKTLVSAYLIGSQGTPQQAILLGVTTTITHTIGIFLLGAIALFASAYVVPEQLYPVLSGVSGITIFLVGLSLLKQRLHSHSYNSHAHSSQEHTHDHDHHHDHHDHHHHPPAATMTLSSLVKLGIAGGLVPCPTALIMLLGAIALHHIAYGLFLVSGFSLGLSCVLVILGLLAVFARQWLEKFPQTEGILQRLSLFSAVVVVIIGIGLTFVATNSLPDAWG
ncbi:MAG: high frequency lysogenization protein HflD [Coleofasciculaceae cyanobacterium SM2_1_6]|nr:high frequency lysogenization protein HflD [Coleofasciculaceae cyanobacterium SM2_1_6]